MPDYATTVGAWLHLRHTLTTLSRLTQNLVEKDVTITIGTDVPSDGASHAIWVRAEFVSSVALESLISKHQITADLGCYK